MIEDELDQALGRLFRRGLSLPPEQEEVLWLRFAAHTRHDEHAWIAFREVMLQTAACVRQAAEWSSWPVRGVPGVA
jgi:hypothetical protein